MDGADADAPLCHHIPGHRAVDAPGQQQQRPAGAAHRQSPCTGAPVRMHIGVGVPDLHGDNDLRMVHVHGQVGEPVQQDAPQLPADLRGFHGEGLV